ncbi:hypothetical protein CYY_003348 [Polysphondylium violaceum]|uniref:BRCT domain-containing protein n=1 Tax=Polysphondylium violaceum TaxID=133409 RepID=A0A8J4PZP2_9MYCE|nr:hypothetical protein CYY_003348 [Polysphondylium violaceum]
MIPMFSYETAAQSKRPLSESSTPSTSPIGSPELYKYSNDFPPKRKAREDEYSPPESLYEQQKRESLSQQSQSQQHQPQQQMFPQSFSQQPLSQQMFPQPPSFYFIYGTPNSSQMGNNNNNNNNMNNLNYSGGFGFNNMNMNMSSSSLPNTIFNNNTNLNNCNNDNRKTTTTTTTTASSSTKSTPIKSKYKTKKETAPSTSTTTNKRSPNTSEEDGDSEILPETPQSKSHRTPFQSTPGGRKLQSYGTILRYDPESKSEEYYSLQKERSTIGGTKSSTIFITTTGKGKKYYANIISKQLGNLIYLEPLCSTSVRVNGEIVQTNRVLKNGDRINIKSSILMFYDKNNTPPRSPFSSLQENFINSLYGARNSDHTTEDDQFVDDNNYNNNSNNNSSNNDDINNNNNNIDSNMQEEQVEEDEFVLSQNSYSNNNNNNNNNDNEKDNNTEVIQTTPVPEDRASRKKRVRSSTRVDIIEEDKSKKNKSTSTSAKKDSTPKKSNKDDDSKASNISKRKESTPKKRTKDDDSKTVSKNVSKTTPTNNTSLQCAKIIIFENHHFSINPLVPDKDIIADFIIKNGGEVHPFNSLELATKKRNYTIYPRDLIFPESNLSVIRRKSKTVTEDWIFSCIDQKKLLPPGRLIQRKGTVKCNFLKFKRITTYPETLTKKSKLDPIVGELMKDLYELQDLKSTYELFKKTLTEELVHYGLDPLPKLKILGKEETAVLSFVELTPQDIVDKNFQNTLVFSFFWLIKCIQENRYIFPTEPIDPQDPILFYNIPARE